jgi:TonB family protein
MTTKTDDRVLRIGIIQGVRVLEERVIERRGPVSVGSGAGSTFQLPASDLPKATVLFDVVDGQYELLLTEAMSGRLEQATGKTEFAALRSQAKRQGDTYRIPLPTESKGRIKLSDDVTVLFHFVPRPAVAPAVVAPRELGAGLVGIVKNLEPIYAAALAASFVIHLAMGSYIKVTDPPQPAEDEGLTALVERLQPPKVEVKLPPAPTPTAIADNDGAGKGKTDEPVADKGTGKPSGGDKNGGAPAKGKPGAGTGGGGGIGDRGAVRDAIAGKGILALIGGRGGAGGGDGAVGSVFSSAGAGISDDVGAALSGTAGVGIAGGAGGGAGVTRRGAGGGDGSGGDGSGGSAIGIGDLSTGGGPGGSGSINTGEKTATRIQARVKTDDLGEADGTIDKKSVSATIRRRQDGFQQCYETALKQNSKLQGKLVVEFTIAEDGRVREAKAVKDGLGSAEVSSCVVNLMKRLKFPPPKDGDVTITNSFVFQPG